MNLKPSVETMNGRTVLLTGAGGGIGLEAARVFAAMGARTILAEIQRDKGKKRKMPLTPSFRTIPRHFTRSI